MLGGKCISVGDRSEPMIVYIYRLSLSVGTSRVVNPLLSPYPIPSGSQLSFIILVAAEAVWDVWDIILAPLRLIFYYGEAPRCALIKFSFSISEIRSSKSLSWFRWDSSFINFSSYWSNLFGELDWETAKSPESRRSSFLGDVYFYLYALPFCC